MKSLEGKTALVTGASRNIGRAIALALAEDGANVVVNGVSDGDAAAAVADEVAQKGVKSMAHLADVSNADGAADLMAAVSEAFPAVDILILNASTRGQAPFLEMAYSDFRRVVDVTLDGAFHLSQMCLPGMVERGWGRIIGLSGVSWQVGMANRVHNLTGKAGIVGFIRGIAAEFAGSGVTANCISPGLIETVRPASAGSNPGGGLDIPVGRKGQPDEIAATARFLAQPSAAYITGQTINVNGGLHMG